MTKHVMQYLKSAREPIIKDNLTLYLNEKKRGCRYPILDRAFNNSIFYKNQPKKWKRGKNKKNKIK